MSSCSTFDNSWLQYWMMNTLRGNAWSRYRMNMIQIPLSNGHDHWPLLPFVFKLDWLVVREKSVTHERANGFDETARKIVLEQTQCWCILNWVIMAYVSQAIPQCGWAINFRPLASATYFKEQTSSLSLSPKKQSRATIVIYFGKLESTVHGMTGPVICTYIYRMHACNSVSIHTQTHIWRSKWRFSCVYPSETLE